MAKKPRKRFETDGGMTRKGGQPFLVNGRKFFYYNDGNIYDSNHRLYAGSYDSLELAKKSLEKNFESIKKGNFYADGGMMAKGGRVELIFHGSSREIPMGEFESSYSIKKIEPKVARTQFEEEVFEYADGGKLSDEEFIQEAVNFMNYNGYADIVSDGKGGWLVSYLDEDEDYIDVEYDSQGVVYLALQKGFNEDEDFEKGGVTSKAEDLKKVIGKETSENGSPTLRAKLIKVGRSNSIFESVKSPYVKNVDAKKIGVKYSVPNYIAWNAFFFGNGGEFDFKPYGKTKGRYKIEYVEEGKKQSEVWESKEMVEDRGKKLLKLGCTNIKITEVEKMARGGEPKPSLIPDYKKISGVEVEDIDMADYPDFSDAYISYAEYDGEPMTDEQLEELNQDGYFVYDAIQRRLFADGGMMDAIQFDRKRNGSLYDRGNSDSYYGRARDPHWYPNGTYNGEKVTELTKKEIEEYNKGYDENTDYKDYGEMARGGKVKNRWIQDALSGNKGELRKTAKRKGLIKGDEKLSKSDLRKLKKMGGKTAKRARLAETLIEFKK
jgi:hypothetical protein